MTTLDSPTERLVIGDDFDVERDVVGIPAGDKLSEAWLTIKESEFDPASAAIIAKYITPAAVAGSGEISEVGDSSGMGVILFQLLAAETSLLDGYTRYVYDIQVKTANGKVFTRESGGFTPQIQITVSPVPPSPLPVPTPVSPVWNDEAFDSANFRIGAPFTAVLSNVAAPTYNRWRVVHGRIEWEFDVPSFDMVLGFGAFEIKIPGGLKAVLTQVAHDAVLGSINGSSLTNSTRIAAVTAGYDWLQLLGTSTAPTFSGGAWVSGRQPATTVSGGGIIFGVAVSFDVS